MAFLEMRNITKRFPGVLANDHVSLQVERGEIHALLGENGAGKSTLMNILYGMYQPDEGEILLRGERVCLRSAKEAIACGIGMVHQHFMLVDALSVIENVVLGLAGNKKVLDLNGAARDVQALAQRYGMDLDPFAKVWQLSVGQQQQLEIIKALYRGADLLILDEPTAVLTPQEVEELFQIMRQLSGEGHTIIFISHKLSEVMTICTTCTVLRQGHLEATVDTCDIRDKSELARLMVGHEVERLAQKKTVEERPVVLEVEGLRARNNKDLPALREVTFSIRGGEILGVAGVEGNGQSELVECLTGLRKIKGGAVRILGRDTTSCSPRQITEQGVAHIPEDRHKRGMVREFSVKENLMMMGYYRPPFCRRGMLDWSYIRSFARDICEEYQVKTPDIETPAGTLSGGNQQRFVVGRELSRAPRLLIAMHPDRGLDIGATQYIQSRIVAERNKGAAVLLVSSELDEIMALSDRIMVMYEGQAVIVDADGVTREELGLMMAGAREDGADDCRTKENLL